jgi:hypothetical protein
MLRCAISKALPLRIVRFRFVVLQTAPIGENEIRSNEGSKQEAGRGEFKLFLRGLG